jgi:hypothetical protein
MGETGEPNKPRERFGNSQNVHRSLRTTSAKRPALTGARQFASLFPHGSNAMNQANRVVVVCGGSSGMGNAADGLENLIATFVETFVGLAFFDKVFDKGCDKG